MYTAGATPHLQNGFHCTDRHETRNCPRYCLDIPFSLITVHPYANYGCQWADFNETLV